MASQAEAMARGIEHQQSGELAQAEAMFRQVLDIQPANQDARFRLAIVCRLQGRPAEAIGLLSKSCRATGTQPSSATTWPSPITIWGTCTRLAAPSVPLSKHSNKLSVCSHVSRKLSRISVSVHLDLNHPIRHLAPPIQHPRPGRRHWGLRAAL